MKVIENNKSAMVGIQAIGEHSIAKGSEAHIISLVRDKLYPNPLKAAICETICNAIDEHRTHKVKRPVEVVVTATEVVIRDYAKGLSEEQVINVFFAFGASTKNTSNEAIGGFGIGAKAPSAYASSWVVESRFQGKHSVYNTSLNGSKGIIGRLFEKECPLEDTGITVRIPIQKESDRLEILALAGDMRIQIGFFQDENEIEIYNALKLNSYNDVLCSWDSDPSQKENQRLSDDCYTPWKSLRRENKGNQYLPEVGFLAEVTNNGLGGYNGPQGRLDINKRLFVPYNLRSEFFKKCSYEYNALGIWLYDGDMLYRTSYKLGNEFERDTAEFKLFHSIETRKFIPVLFIPKGVFQIAPSRESLVESDELHNYLRNQWKKLITYYSKSLDEFYKFIQDNKQDDFFISLCKAQHKFYYPFYTRHLSCCPYFENYFSSCNIDSVYSVHQVLQQLEDFSNGQATTQEAIESAYELETEKWKESELRSYKLGSTYQWGIVRYVLVPSTENYTQVNRIAKAVVLKIASELTPEQWEYYSKADTSAIVIFVTYDADKEDYTSLFWLSEKKRIWFCDKDIIHLNELTPYVELLATRAKEIAADLRAQAALEAKQEQKVKTLISTTHSIIPDNEYSQTLLFAPSQEANYNIMAKWLWDSQESTAGGILIRKLMSHLGFKHLAKCTKADMPYYTKRGAVKADAYDWRLEAYKFVMKPNYIRIPDGLYSLADYLPGVYEALDKQLAEQGKIIDRKGISKELNIGVYDVFNVIEKLPTTTVTALRKERETEINRQFFDVFEKLSEKDLLTLYYGIELFKKRERVAYIFNGNYTYMQPVLDRLAESRKVHAEKAAAVVIKKILPKLKMDWNLFAPVATKSKRKKSKQSNTEVTTNNK